MSEQTEFNNIEDATAYIRLLGKPIPELPPLSTYKPKLKEIIAGGDPTREPVDRVARRVVAPAQEHFKPPEQQLSKMNESHKPQVTSERQRNRDHNMENAQRSREADPTSIVLQPRKQADEDILILDESAKKFEKNVRDTESLVKRGEDAHAAIEYMVTHVQRAWAEYDEWLTKAMIRARATKVAIEIETKQTITTLGDVRKFFLDPRHEEEIQRLKEFVQLCERLRELKRDGFLDGIVDTILKLEIGNE